MAHDFYHPLTLGVRVWKPRGLHAGGRRIRERSYDEFWESARREQSIYEPVPETGVLSFLTGAAPADGKLWLILGEPGAGKSTLFKQWFDRIAADMRPKIGMCFPVLVNLRTLSPEFAELDGQSLVRLFWQKRDLGKGQLPAGLRHVYEKGSLDRVHPIWLLDGLDELPREIRTDELFAKLASFPGAKAVSCRTAVYDDCREEAERYQEHAYEILTLESEDQAAFLHALVGPPEDADALHRDLESSPQLRPLAGSPRLLRIVAEHFRAGELPSTRPRFYAQAVSGIWHSNLRSIPASDYDRATSERDDVLTAFAQAMALERLNETTRFLHQIAEPICGRFTHTMSGCLERSGILEISREHGSYVAFLHLTFHEYFLACSFRVVGLVAAFERHWASPRYEETLALVISLLVNGGEHHTVENAVSKFTTNGQSRHDEDPEAMWDLGRSPLRVALHVLARAGESAVVPGSPLERQLIDAVRVSLHRKRAVAGDRRMPHWMIRALSNDPDDEIRATTEDTLATHGQGMALEAGRSPRFGEGKGPVRSGRSRTPRRACAFAGTRSDPAGAAPALELPVPNADGALEEDFDADSRRRRIATAENPATTAAALARLASDADPAVRQAVASAPATSSDLLAVLAGDEDAGVRQRVAAHPRTDQAVLARLAQEASVETRTIVAANPSAHSRTLVELLGDENEEVRSAAVRNPSILLEDL